MFRFSRIVILSLFVACAPLWQTAVNAEPAPAPPLSAETVSLLPDGRFEAPIDATGRPDGWPASASATWPAEAGNRFLRIASTAPAAMDNLRIEAPIPAGVRALEFSYRGRVSDLKRGEKTFHDARVIMNFKNAAGEVVGSAPPSYHRNNTADWRVFTSRFLVPEGAVIVEFMPTLFRVRSGVFDLDDVVLRPTDAAVVEAEVARKRPPPPPAAEAAQPEKWPPELTVVGNELRDKAGRAVWLQGVNVASMEWTLKGEHVLSSVVVAIEKWNANVIRLPIKDQYWLGKGEGQTDGGEAYRALVDEVVKYASNRGAYVVLDLHNYRAPRPEHIDFWTDAATRYKNHPAVLFDLLNEPHGISWEVWRNGGYVQERKAGADEDNFLSDEDKIQAKLGFRSPGMQRMLEVVRETGARNIVVAGGLDYAYDLSGIVNGFALEEKGGNGVMYASHIYPWKRNWQGKALDAAALHPILIGEVGADNRKQPWENETNFVPPETWLPDMLGLIQKHRLNWTGWCFHVSAGPAMLADWRYTPTSYWGDYAKRALAGERFELKRLR